MFDKFVSCLNLSSSNYSFSYNKELAYQLVLDIKDFLFYDFFHPSFSSIDLLTKYNKIKDEIVSLVDNKKIDADKFLNELEDNLIKIKNSLFTSIISIYKGDPACISYKEIIDIYPSFNAILYYRISNLFHLYKQDYLARIISEKAHCLYGIDIHPSATIGDYFFIDHGTGIVIGETSIIKNNVKIYQGVTLGALSLKEGHLLKGKKRHPTILDNVIIYSNASIFGGQTIIGCNSIIGANTYITSSIPSNCKVYLNSKTQSIYILNDGDQYVI